MNSNKMERLNGEFRDGEKIVREIKIKDSILIRGCQLYHNYLYPHVGLNGMIPAEAYEVKIEEINKWKTLIENASVKN